MVVNIYILTYLVFSFLSLSVGLLATGTGIYSRKIKGIDVGSEAYHRFEKIIYLVITAVGVGLIVRMAMIPLWFWTLHSLIPEVTGAMCMAGVHMVDAHLSFTASILKIAVVFLYLLWILMNNTDHVFEEQPFLTKKLNFLLFIGIVMVAESVLDLKFLLLFEPRIVACCTSLFDNVPPGAHDIITSTTPFWTVMFYILNVVFFAAGILLHLKNIFWDEILFLILTLMMVLVFFLALHTYISPVLLDAPFHHCIFCLWQVLPSSIIFTIFIVLGLSLCSNYALLTMGRKSEKVKGYLKRYLIEGMLLEASGLVIMSALLIKK